jgi:hypothetical protein
MEKKKRKRHPRLDELIPDPKKREQIDVNKSEPEVWIRRNKNLELICRLEKNQDYPPVRSYCNIKY